MGRNGNVWMDFRGWLVGENPGKYREKCNCWREMGRGKF
jgi:hypothetical protein